MKLGLAGRIASAFADSKLTPLLIGAALATGAVLLGLSSRPTQQPGATVQWVR